MTLSRRNLLRQSMAAAVAFIGCSGRWALAQEPQRRREIVVNGKRVRTVNMHAHCHIPEATALASHKEYFLVLVIGPERTKEMDEQGIDVEALSINPNFWDKLDRDLQAQIVKLQNEKLAELCTKEPERFVGLGSVALAHPDLAVEQLEYGAKRLGLRGALVGGSVNGVELSDRRFDPFWAKAEALGVVVFIYPQGTPELAASGRLKGNGVLGNTIGNPLEATIALSHLIFEGTLDRYPEVKILGAHAGG
jgi:aminocarboxymuconate-semialdehyde decarboxylase